MEHPLSTLRASQAHHTGAAHKLFKRVSLSFVLHPIQAILSALLILGFLYFANIAWQWLWVQAVFSTNESQCAAQMGQGACWGMVREKLRIIVFGRYPFEEQWRAALCLMCLLALACWTSLPQAWQGKHRQKLLGLWMVSFCLCLCLMSGRLIVWSLQPFLSPVSSELWGGLPLTLLLSMSCIVLATPLGIALALGRRSDWVVIKVLCTIYIEVVRAVPLISVLFMASFMLPMFLPPSLTPDALMRVLIGITLFAGAYTAEVVRGGLQSISPHQLAAAQSLGLGYWQIQMQVMLPQALTHVIPGLVNNFISIFKDTSLITIVSLYELTGSLGLAINGDPIWRPYKIEGYLFIAFIYFVFCFAASTMSRHIEKTLKPSKS